MTLISVILVMSHAPSVKQHDHFRSRNTNYFLLRVLYLMHYACFIQIIRQQRHRKYNPKHKDLFQ